MSQANIDIHYVSQLARLDLTPAEELLLRDQLRDVLGYVEKLRELEVSAVEPMSHAVPLANVTRPDRVRPSLPQSEALSNAPACAEGLFLVPRIVE